MVSPPVNLRSAGIVVNSPRTRLSFSSTDYLCAAQSYAIHWYGVEWYGVEWIPIQSIGNAFQLVSIPFGMDDDGFGAGEITTVPDAVTVRTRHPQRVPEPVRDLFGGWEQGSKRVLAHVSSLRDNRPWRPFSDDRFPENARPSRMLQSNTSGCTLGGRGGTTSTVHTLQPWEMRHVGLIRAGRRRILGRARASPAG